MTVRPAVLLLLPVLAAGGCATVKPTAADQAPPARVLTAAELRAAAVGPADLGAGYTVTVLNPGQAVQPQGAERQLADVPACQPVLDAIGPADPAAQPQAETDLTAIGPGTAKVPLYTALLGYPAGRSAVLQSALEAVLAQCADFTSGVAGGAAAARTRHQLVRADTPTPGGADGATAFTLTSGPQAGGPVLSQRAAVVRVGTALAVFSTVGTAKEAAAVPDPAVVLAQTRKLRAAQG
ncbi:hypothetical protein OG455_24250 [Kitasatospora sp. NBC_01287]|uniref:hypothetical protein n=1 Tax=Kitasatospora sp. NBC_01287 TaxID=2903573 RepID=UPI0022502D86|nr:hypothetical protein [Kitasatospora sp. NBC_01287]MCX4748591.1 hypothetical protein [Kitasatospora sp. NBC_01287]